MRTWPRWAATTAAMLEGIDLAVPQGSFVAPVQRRAESG